MHPTKQVTKSWRGLISPKTLCSNKKNSLFQSPSSSAHFNNNNNGTSLPLLCSSYYYSTLSTTSIQPIYYHPNFTYKHVVQSFKDWFNTQNCGLLDRILEILRSQDEIDEVALSQLGLHVTEKLVLDVLNRGNSRNEVLSCLKFFDWAGRQSRFFHTRATYHTIFKILSKAKLRKLMFDFLDNLMKLKFRSHGFAFNDTLVMGYSVAGKPLVALQLFGKMRFLGVDLDPFTYHVLLRALVEEGHYDAVKDIARGIAARGFESHITHSIVVKSFCKQNKLDEAVAYLRCMVLEGEIRNGVAVGFLVDAFCRNGQFQKAGQLVEEFKELGVAPMEPAYGAWLRNLVQRGKLDGALEFLQHKKSIESYVPEVFRYNALMCRLLNENRLIEAFDLLVEMMEGGITPDQGTMNMVLCFFCKAGMVDVALDLYNYKSEFGLSPSAMACNYLINSLCREGNSDTAYHVLKNSINNGYFPGKRAFSILTDALHREGKLEMMKELIFFALEHNFMPTDSMYDKFISALCSARMLEEGYLLHEELNRINRVAKRSTYLNLIHGFSKLNRGDIAARLLIEMQDKGHMGTRSLFREIIQSLCDMDKPETRFFEFFEIQLSRHAPNCQIYNFFIDGAGHGKKPDLSRKVFEMMQRNGIKPNLSTDILMLQCYLKNGRINDAFNFFDALRQRRKIGRKLFNTMVVGLCKINEVDRALSFFWEIHRNGLLPSFECYEVLIMLLCSNKRYNIAIALINDLETTGRRVTSFIGNVLLWHSLRSDELYNAFCQEREMQIGASRNLSVLHMIIGAFSGCLNVSQQFRSWEELIELGFPLDLYTYNLILRRLCMSNIDGVYEMFDRLCRKGYEPNRWTYDILVNGFYNQGRREEASRWMDEKSRRGFEPTYDTRKLTRVTSRTR